MKEIFVNEIIEQDGITHGVIGSNKTVLKNIPIVFQDTKLKIINSILNNPPKEGFHSIDRFCQYVVLTNCNPLFGGLSMKVSDYTTMDLALEEYRKLAAKDWDKDDIDNIMRLVQDIQKDCPEQAKMTIEDIFD